MKEIVSIHIGQAGVQMGNAIWELICTEHGVNEIGVMQEASREYECMDTFFSLSHSNRYIPRSIFVDLEASVIDEVKHGAYKNLFHPDRLITGPEDAASNFARGFFTVGKLLLGVVSHELKKLLESGDNTQAIIIYRSLGGGTGSGLTSAIFDSLADYAKLVKIEMPVYPSPTLSTAMVEPYNCLLSEHFCMEDIDLGLLLDNEALYDICSKYLSLTHPTYSTINRLISQLVSSITASVRFESVMNCDITVLQTNLVPYPRIHFPLANFAPVLSQSKAIHEELTVTDLTRAVFEKENQMMKIDHSFGRFMSCSLLYRGEVSPYHVYNALSVVKKDKNIEFVDWCPTGFKVGINVCPPTTVPASEIYQSSRNLTMLANTSAIGQAWQRITHKFYLLYSKRSFVHWFIGEGMEECEFTESLYNISALVKDYEEVTLDRDFEEESGGAGTTEKDGIDAHRDQSNTAFTETTKRSMKPSESISKPSGSVKPSVRPSEESTTDGKRSMKNEQNYAEEKVLNEEEASENIVENADEAKEEDSKVEENNDEEEEETADEDNANDQNAGEESSVNAKTEEENADEGSNEYKADEDTVDKEKADEENGEDNADEEGAEEENADEKGAEEGSDEEEDEENQNNKTKANVQTSNNCGESSEMSNDCCTINDNTLDHIKASIVEEDLITKEYYNSNI